MITRSEDAVFPFQHTYPNHRESEYGLAKRELFALEILKSLLEPADVANGDGTYAKLVAAKEIADNFVDILNK